MIRIVRLRHNAPPVGVFRGWVNMFVRFNNEEASHVPKSTIAAGIIANPDKNRPARGQISLVYFCMERGFAEQSVKMAISGL